MRKQILSILLVTALFFTLLPQTALPVSAEIYSGTCGAEGDGSNLTWTLDTDTGLFVINGDGEMATFPGVWAVTWRDYKDLIKTVKIGNGVTCLSEHAFSDCPNLTSVEFPDTLEWIGDSAFAFCSSISTIALPSSLTYIGWGAFAGCHNLTSITIYNPTCRINNDDITLGDAAKTTIYGYFGSTAEKYANTYGYSFVGIKYDFLAFSFLNSANKENPYAGFDEKDGYYISGDYYTAIRRRCNPIEFIKLLVIKNSTWGGHCFGMSSVYTLYNSDKLNLPYYQEGATKLSDLHYPKYDSNILSMLTYYHFVQISEMWQYRYTLFSGESQDNKEAVLSEIKEEITTTGNPVLLGLKNHAIVATDYSETDTQIVIGIWDPNYFEPDVMYVKKDYSEVSFESGHYTGEIELITAFRASEIPNFEGEIIADYLANHRQQDTDSVFDGTELIVNYENFSITVGNQSAEITLGQKTNGDLQISDGFPLNEDGGPTQLSFLLNDVASNDQPIVIHYSDSGQAAYQTLITYHSTSPDGYLAMVDSNQPGSITVLTNGSITTSFPADTVQTISVTQNDSELNWDTASFSGTNTGFTVTQKEDAVLVSDVEDTIEATVSKYDQEIFFGDSAVSGKGISIISDEGQELLIDNNSGETIASEHLPISVYFNSLGGSLIEPKLNVPEGTVVAAPEHPSRQGFVFCGWYKSTDYDADELWDFTTPITENLTLYAKWEEVSISFVDVPDDAYYATPVAWAVEHGITNGTSATTFSPNNTCTRAQVVTFLWRARGCPEPKTTNNPFTDVQADAYYYKAVLWAVEQGITNGTSATTFGPNNGCTRAQVVTFLWRTEGQPEPKTADNPFTDVTSGYYYKAVLWAVEQKITNGTSATTFGPDATCTRGQIVTFLYRDLAE